MSRQRTTGKQKSDQPADGSGRFRAAVAVFSLAAVVRFVYLAQSSAAPSFNVPVVDAGTYDMLARNMISGKGPADIFWQPVFYPLWLVGVYKVTGGSILAAKILQMLVGACTCVLVFLLGEKSLGRKGGILAGIIAALYMPMVFLEGELLATAWESLWFVALIALSLSAREKKAAWLCFLLGVCGALAALTRPNFIPVVAALWVWLAWSWHKEKAGARMLLFAACGAAGFAMLAVPVAQWSYKTNGRFSILPNSGGLNMYIGNNPDWQRTVTIRPGVQWRELTELPLKDGVKDKAGANRWFYAKVRQYAQEQPLSFVKGLATRAVQFVTSREIPRNVDIYMYRQWSGLMAAGVWKTGPMGFPFGLLLPLAAVGAWRWRRNIPVVLWVVVGLYAASIIIVFIAGRYRMPLVGVLCVPAAGGVLAIAEMVRQKWWSKAGVAAIVVVVIATAISIAGPFPQEKIDYNSEMWFELGNSLRDRARLPEAEKAYARAVEIRPDYADAHNDLASILKNRGAASEAIAHYEAAIRYGLDNGDVQAGLGEALVRQRRFDEAMEHFRRAVSLSPDNAKVRNNLGNLLAMKGQHKEAIEQLEESLRLEPTDAKTLNNLANALAAVGELGRAEEMYRKSIAIEPNSAGTHYNLAVCLRRAGKNADAAKEFAETLRLDPSHASARRAIESP